MKKLLSLGIVLCTLMLSGAACNREANLSQKVTQSQSEVPPAESSVVTTPAPIVEPKTTPTPPPATSSPVVPPPPAPHPTASTPPSPPPAAPLTFRSATFASGAMIPAKYTCDGSDVNPSLSWSGGPEGIKSFALIINDPDAVSVVGHVIDHWVLWNIPATTTSIAEHSVPAGASQGMGYDAAKYQGPCPPSGETHRYVFTLYALDVLRLNLPSATTGASLRAALQSHLLKKAEFTGRFTAH